MTKYKGAYLAAILYAIIIGFSFMFVKIALIHASPVDTLAHRFTIAFTMATILILFKKIPLKILLRDIWTIFPLTLLYPTLFFMFQIFGLVYSSSSEAGIIQATIPIFTMVLASIFLKEYSTHLQKVSILLSVLGVIFLFVMNGVNIDGYSVKGTVLILLSALAASSYNVLARKLTKQYSLFFLTYVMTGFITFNSIAITNHLIASSFTNFLSPFLNTSFLASILYLGILSSLCTSFLSNYALSIMDASKMSVFSNLATLITMMAGVIFLNEKLQYYHILGAILILTGVIGVNYFGNKKGRIRNE